MLSLTCAPLLTTVEAKAATVSFTKAYLAQLTGLELSSTSIQKGYNKLKTASVWTTLGYTSADAGRIASRFTQSYSQAIGILKSITAGKNVELKVVTVNNPYYKTVNIGTLEQQEQVVAPTTSEVPAENNQKANETVETAILSQLVKEIDMEVEYKHDSIDLEYDVSSRGKIKAEVDNELTNVELKGAKAQAYIENLFKGLDVKNSSKETIKNHILSKLNAPKSGEKFEFKVKFADKTKVDLKIK